MNIRFPFGEKGFYRMLHVFFLVGIGLFGLGNYFGIVSRSRIHVMVAVCVVIMLTGFQYLSVRGQIFGLLSVLGCMGAIGVIVGFENMVQFINSYMHWLFGRMSWKNEWIPGYEILQVIFLSLICFFIQLLFEKDFRIKLAGVLLLLGGFLYCLVTGKELPEAGVALLLCYILAVATEWTQRGWKKCRNKGIQAYMIWLTPFLVFYIILLLAMPVPKKPYDWQWVKDIVSWVSESVTAFSQNVFTGGKEDYDLGLSGFSEDGALGGNVSANRRELMTVQGDKRLKTNVYLMGKVYDTFDGIEWRKDIGDLPKERYMDSIETVYAVQCYNREFFEDYLQKSELKINYRYFHSSYLFAPLKMWTVEQNNKTLFFEESGGSLFFEKKLGFGTEYETGFYQMNMKRKVFDEFLETKPTADEKLLKELLLSLETTNDVKISLADFSKRKEMIYASYLEDIKLSKEAEAYLEQMTEGAESDVEKLRAIEATLSAFTYNRTPGDLPEKVTDGSTFLDYFLLESRQGYCSHFATAFVLLARTQGIPARYVQGYCVPVRDNEPTVVVSDMAHAWPEVYIEDIGWIPFEPTPGYARMRYTPWEIQQDDVVVSTDAETDRGATVQVPIKPEIVPEEVETEEVEQISEAYNWSRIWWITFFTFAIVVGVGTLLLLLDNFIGKYRYKKLDIRQRYVVEMRRNLRILSWLELKQREGETLEELQRRVNLVLAPQKEFRFVEEYEEFLYGEKAVEERMLRLMKEEQERLLQILKQKKKWSYLYYSLLNKSLKMNIL